MIITNSPHNPTGAVFHREDIDNLARIVDGTNIFLLSDEVYEHIVFDGLRHQSLLLEKSITMNATLVLMGILSFIGAFHFSVGPVMWVLFSEIFPISVRGIAIPFFTIITSLTISIC